MERELVGKIYEKLEENKVKWIQLQFTDILGHLKQVTIKYRGDREWLEKLFNDGVGKLDGSSITGFQDISESDMQLKPDPNTFAFIPWSIEPTVRFICNSMFRDSLYPKDPRTNLETSLEKIMENYQPYIGAEVEFFIFKDINIVNDVDNLEFYVSINTEEKPIKEGGYTYSWKEGYYTQQALDTVYSFREKLIETLERYFNVSVESHHHEVGIAGQSEINIRYADPLTTADNFMTLKYVSKQLGRMEGYTPVFIPKPIPIDNGSGLHMHISLFKDDENLFYDPDDDYAHISQIARYFIGGLIEHGRSLSALVSPTVNSYRRLIPGYEAPVYLVWSRSNRSAAVRVPFYTRKGKNTKIEYRPPDPSCNPYLAITAIFAAGLDGIKRKIDPGDPIDENVYHMDDRKRRSLGIKTLPRDLIEALEELESDREFLKGYISDELLETYIDLKRQEHLKLVKFASAAEYKFYSSI